MTEEEFITELKQININPTHLQLQQLQEYYHLLIEWNEKINLTRITAEQDVYLKHFYDSLTITKTIDLKEIKTLCDVGTGAGFPGLVLKIFFPNIKVTLLDSLNKRVIFLNTVINKLHLSGIKAIHTRGEDYHETFEIVTARAVASLEKLIPYCINLVSDEGYLIAMKANITGELETSKNILKKYHCAVVHIEEFKLPFENSERNILIIKKK